MVGAAITLLFRKRAMYREFPDNTGEEWRVWEVRPETFRDEERDARYIAPELARGWYTFESKSREHRRLAPYPSAWATLTDGELTALCRVALLAPPRGPGQRRSR